MVSLTAHVFCAARQQAVCKKRGAPTQQIAVVGLSHAEAGFLTGSSVCLVLGKASRAWWS